MRLGINTFVFEAGQVPIIESLRRIHSHDFKYVDLAPVGSIDPSRLSNEKRKEIVKVFHDLGLISSQMLCLETENLTTSDPAERNRILDHLKRVSDFQIQLSGRQVLICWGGGVFRADMMREEAWVNSVSLIRAYAEWAQKAKLLCSIELDPGVFFLNNDLYKMTHMLEDIDMPNVFANIDIGHLNITREPPQKMEKLRDKIIHVHISDNDGMSDANSIIGSGNVDFVPYIDRLRDMGIDETAERYGEVAVAAIEMGEDYGKVDDPDRWIRESVSYIKKTFPKCAFQLTEIE